MEGIPRIIRLILAVQITIQSVYCITIFNPNPYSHQNHFNVLFNSKGQESNGVSKLKEPLRWLGYWRVCSPYGVFKGIPNYHGEIRFSGSKDGVLWKDYQFKFLPSGKTDQISFFAPYYPRLDHLMFYETLSESNHKHNPLNQYYSYQNEWTCKFIRSLLTNNEDVLKLIGKNPFPDEPPTFIKTTVFRLSFDETKNKFWKEEKMGFERIFSADSCNAPLISYEQAMKTVSNQIQ
jgi:hypothetical protein